MPQGFIDPQSPFADMMREGAAAEWGVRAVALAKAAGQSVDAASLDRWLDQAEPDPVKTLRKDDPALYQERYEEAAAAARKIASFERIWRG